MFLLDRALRTTTTIIHHLHHIRCHSVPLLSFYSPPATISLGSIALTKVANPLFRGQLSTETQTSARFMNIRRKREFRIILTLSVSPLPYLFLFLSVIPPSFMASTGRGVKETHATYASCLLLSSVSRLRVFAIRSGVSHVENSTECGRACVTPATLSIFTATLTQNAKVRIVRHFLWGGWWDYVGTLRIIRWILSDTV